MPAPLPLVPRLAHVLAVACLLAAPASAQDGLAAADPDAAVSLSDFVPGAEAPAEAPRSAALTTFLEDFEDGVNQFGITLGIPQAETIEPSGGNPGQWLLNDVLDTFVPSVSTRSRAFTGDFVARGARAIRLDAQTVDATFGVQERPFTLILTTFNGQPNNPNAYDYVYRSGGLAPQVGEGWRSYTYLVPARFPGELPEGWTGGYSGDPENLRPGVEWRDILSQVDEVRVLWGDPAFFYIGQQFDLGVDNVRIDYVNVAQADAGQLADAGELGPDAHVAAGAQAEAGAVLHPTHPNPFAGTSRVAFSLADASPVTLDVVDLTGRRVARLAEGVFQPGEHAVAWQATGLPPGLYLVRLQTDRSVQVQRAVVVD